MPDKSFVGTKTQLAELKKAVKQLQKLGAQINYKSVKESIKTQTDYREYMRDVRQAIKQNAPSINWNERNNARLAALQKSLKQSNYQGLPTDKRSLRRMIFSQKDLYDMERIAKAVKNDKTRKTEAGITYKVGQEKATKIAVEIINRRRARERVRLGLPDIDKDSTQPLREEEKQFMPINYKGVESYSLKRGFQMRTESIMKSLGEGYEAAYERYKENYLKSIDNGNFTDYEKALLKDVASKIDARTLFTETAFNDLADIGFNYRSGDGGRGGTVYNILKDVAERLGFSTYEYEPDMGSDGYVNEAAMYEL